MASITRYVLVDMDDNEGDHEFDSYDEAVNFPIDLHPERRRHLAAEEKEQIEMIVTPVTPAAISRLIPLPPPRAEAATEYIYGCQILMYLLAMDYPTCAALENSDLESAQAASVYAIAQREELNQAALDRIVEVRRLVVSTLNQRQQAAARALAVLAAPPPPPPPGRPQDDNDHDGGTKVPTHPKPTQRPPAGEKVEIAF